MLVSEFRSLVLGQIDWDPQNSDEFKARFLSGLNRLVASIYLSFKDRVALDYTVQPLEPDIVSGTNDHLLRSALPSATPLGLDGLHPFVCVTQYTVGNMSQVLATDGSLDGRFIKMTQGSVTHYNIIRSVTVTGGSKTSSTLTFVLVKPMPTTLVASTAINWTIFTFEYPMSGDIQNVRKVELRDTNNYSLGLLEYKETGGFPDSDPYINTGGAPLYVHRTRHLTIPAPKRAPGVALYTNADDSTHWRGPQPFGRFRYGITFAWGKINREDEVGGLGTIDNDYDSENFRLLSTPRFESAMSPVSDPITVSYDGQAGYAKSVQIALPRFDFEMGIGMALSGSFGNFVDPQLGRGIRARLWRKRETEDWTNYTTLTSDTYGATLDGARRVYDDSRFELIADGYINSTNNGYIYDYGDKTGFRYYNPATGSYNMWKVWPRAFAAYKMAIAYYKQPPVLVDDNDTIPVPYDFMNYMLAAMKVIVYRMNQEWERAREIERFEVVPMQMELNNSISDRSHKAIRPFPGMIVKNTSR